MEFVNESERNDLMADMADLYYKQGKTQSEIARLYDTNRFKVAKLIQDALDEGVVEIRINYSTRRNLEAEKRLMEMYPLQKAIVVNTKYSESAETLSQIGKAGAAYMTGLLKQNPTMGITWGKTLYSTISQMKAADLQSVNIVQLTGDSNMMNPLYDTRELVRILATGCGGSYHYMHAPLYLRFAGVKEMFYREPAMAQVLAQAKNMGAIVSGIGGVSSLPLDNPAVYPYLTEQDIAAGKDCIGSLYGYVIDRNGEVADMDLNKKLVAFEMKDILQVPRRLVIASGRHKIDVLQRTMEKGLFNELLTDNDTAERLLG